ncbi:MAG: pyridoxal phosphate-dependent aminotransferase, partial [Candidatus Njordarchaeota archaeon]
MRLLIEPKFDLYVDVITTKAKKMKDTIQLQWGELASMPPKNIVEYFEEAYNLGYVRYTLPHGDIDLRKAIVDKLRQKNNIDTEVDNILVTVGGTAAINFVFLAVAGDGSYVLVQDPSWFGYIGISHLVGARLIRLEEVKYGYEMFEEIYSDLRAKDKNLKVIVLNYPSNPTGYVFGADILKEAIDFSEDYDVVLLSDEAYEDYVFEGKHISLGSIRGLDRIVSVFTLSKTYAFTGLRVGYAVGQKEIIDAMAVAQVHTYISPPALNQYVARRILEEKLEEKVLKENLKRLRSNLRVVLDYVEENGWEIIEPRGGIYVFIRLPRVN